MLIVTTGNGKGKTTAALGSAVRAVGRGKKVLMIQWIKGPWKSGEDFIEMKSREGNGEFKLIKKGLGFVGILGDTLPREAHVKAAHDALDLAKQEIAKKYWDLVVFDEINVALSLHLLTFGEVQDVLKLIPLEKFIICTGRGAPQELIDFADLVSEVKEIKHPFNNGKLANIAIEF